MEFTEASGAGNRPEQEPKSHALHRGTISDFLVHRRLTPQNAEHHEAFTWEAFNMTLQIILDGDIFSEPARDGLPIFAPDNTDAKIIGWWIAFREWQTSLTVKEQMAFNTAIVMWE